MPTSSTATIDATIKSGTAIVVPPAILKPGVAPSAPAGNLSSPTVDEATPLAAPSQTSAPAHSSLPTNDLTLPPIDPTTISGDIVATGSSLVYPSIRKIAARFQREGYTGTITSDSVGTTRGFEHLCATAEVDLIGASRSINAVEQATCRANGREPIAFPIGFEAVVVIVSRENDFVEGLTQAQLAQIFSGDVVTWAEVHPDWPNERIEVFVRSADTNDFHIFVDQIFDGNEERALSPPTGVFGHDEDISLGVSASPYGISYINAQVYAMDNDQLKALAIDGVEPMDATIVAGTYPLTHPLFIYSTRNTLREKPHLAAFINYFLTHIDEETENLGYWPADARSQAEARQAWWDAVR